MATPATAIALLLTKEKAVEDAGGMIYSNNQSAVTLRLLSGMARPWPEARGSTPASATHLYRLRSVNQSCTTITTWQTVKRKAAICKDCGSRGTWLQGQQGRARAH